MADDPPDPAPVAAAPPDADPPAPSIKKEEGAPAEPAPVVSDVPPSSSIRDETAAEAAPVVASPPSSPFRRFAFLAIPAIALLELGAHLVQTHRVVKDAEWTAARKAVLAIVQPKDLVAMAPYWTDPLGREFLKDDVLTLAREARPDATRFPRAIEVSIRGQHLPELEGWKVERTQSVGPVTLFVYDNPSYTPVLDDLVDHVAPGRMAVSTPAGECALTHGRVETGPLGFGPAIPADRFTCPQGGMLSATVMQPGDYRPHRCLFTQPLGGGKALRVRFLDVAFGDVLHGHAGIEWDATAHAEEPPVTLAWKIADRTLAKIVAGNEDGWKGFELDTRDLKGQRGEIVAEISSPSSHNRMFCFEADTR